MMQFDRPSRFAAMPSDMKIPPSHLYPERGIPSLWSVRLAAGASEWTWQGYAASSIEATERAIAWLRETSESEPVIRVLEVLQVGA